MTNVVFITNVICLMMNPNKLTIQKILIYFYMNLITLPLMETINYVIDIAKKDKR
jgi:hypothetical protein